MTVPQLQDATQLSVLEGWLGLHPEFHQILGEMKTQLMSEDPIHQRELEFNFDRIDGLLVPITELF